MKNNLKVPDGYSVGDLFIETVRKLFEKRSARLAVSIIAIILSLFSWTIVSQYYGGAIWWASCLINLPFFAVFIAGIGGFVSSIGEFRVKRFSITSVISGTAMWMIMAVYNVISTAFLPIERDLFFKGLGLELLRHMPLLTAALVIVLLPLMISSHGKNKV